MGWFWSSSSDDKSTEPTKSADPLAGLDSDLKDFLSQRTNTPTDHARYSKPEATKDTNEPSPEQIQHDLEEQERAKQAAFDAAQAPTPPPTVPPFANPRYAHLWKTYKPPSNGLGPADDGLMSNIQAFKSRSAALGRAALENCAEYEYALQQCYRDRGRMYSKETMITGFCHPETEALQKCGDYNVGLLKTLGFMDAVSRGVPELELEKIQIRADTIYREFLKQEREEKLRKEAEERGEVPGEGKGKGEASS